MSETLTISLHNCNNIANGTITLVKKHLNLKYAHNGTGKSTIAKSIDAFATDNAEVKKLLQPYNLVGTNDMPAVTGLDDIKSVLIFDDEYVNKHLFIQADKNNPEKLIPNSFNIFIKTPEYDQSIEDIEKLLGKVNKEIASHPEIKETCDLFAKFIDNYGKPKTDGASPKTSALTKALYNGNPLLAHADQFCGYDRILKDSKKSVSWAKWYSQGADFLEEVEICPLCSSALDESKRKDVIKNFETLKQLKIDKLNEVLDNFEKISVFLSDNSKNKLEKIRNNVEKISEDQEAFLKALYTKIKKCYDRLNEITLLNSNSFRPQKGQVVKAEDIVEKLNNLKIDIAYNEELGSFKFKEITNITNTLLDRILEIAEALKTSVEAQNQLYKDIIQKHEANINGFLECAGYNYRIDFDIDGEITLRPRTLDKQVSNVKQHLSYGERNAFAMVLFLYAALRENPDLIILDDPISSFDGNKKFALLNLMFLETAEHEHSGMLKDQTVLMLTHDFGTMLDIVHNLHKAFKKTSAHFLSNIGGNLKEMEVKKGSFHSFKKIAERNIRKTSHNLIKAVYKRRLLDFLGKTYDDPAYNMLSSLFHKVNKPTVKKGENIRAMTPDEIDEATKEIRDEAPQVDFDYGTMLALVQNDDELRKIYNDPSTNNYEKVQIYRIFVDGKPDRGSNVVQKFVNETFHIENDSIYQLDPVEFDIVPQFIIDECDKVMKTLKA